MDPDTLEIIRRSHEVFGAAGPPPRLAGTEAAGDPDQHEPPPAGEAHQHYAGKQLERDTALRAAAGLDAELRQILQQLADSHEQATRESKAVLDAAAADHAPASDTPMGEREATARRAAYLRAQHDIIERAQAQAQQAAEQVRRLRYHATGGA